MKRFLIASLATLSVLPACADVKYTQEMRMPSQGNKSFGKTTIYKRPGAERTESVSQIGTFEQRSITLTLCAKKEMYTLDPTLKMYYVTPLVKASVPAAKAPKASAGTGTLTMTLVSFKPVGSETVGGAKTSCYEVVTRMQSSGCAGNTEHTSKQHLCIAPGASGGLGDGGCTDAMPSYGGGANTCKTSFVRKGNWAAYEKALRGQTMRTRVFTDAKSTTAQMEMITSGVSRAKLPASLFTVPADYRRVAMTEFQQAQSKAMMEKMTQQNNDESSEDSE